MDAGHSELTPSPAQEEMEITADMLLGVWVPYSLAHTEHWTYEDDCEEPVRMPEEAEAKCCTSLAEDSTTATDSSAPVRSEDEAEYLEEDCEVQPKCGVAALATLGCEWPGDSADEVAMEEGQTLTEPPSGTSVAGHSPESCTILEPTREAEEAAQDKSAASSEAAGTEWPGVNDQSTVPDACSPCLGDDTGHETVSREEDFEYPSEHNTGVQARQQHIWPSSSIDTEMSMEEESEEPQSAKISADMSAPGRSVELRTVLQASREADEDEQKEPASPLEAAAATCPYVTVRSPVADACSPRLSYYAGHEAAFQEDDFASSPEHNIAARAIQQCILPSYATDVQMSMKEEPASPQILANLSEAGRSPQLSTVLRVSREADEDEQDKLAFSSEDTMAKCPDATVRSTVADACPSNSGNDRRNDAEFAGEDIISGPACVLIAQAAQEQLGPCEHFADEHVSEEVNLAETFPTISKTGDRSQFHQTLDPLMKKQESMHATSNEVEQTWACSRSRGSAMQMPAVVNGERLPLRRPLLHGLPAIKIRGRGGLDARGFSAGCSTRDSSTRSPDSAASTRSPGTSDISSCGVDSAELTPRTPGVDEQSDMGSTQASPLNPVRIWSAYPECGRVPAMSLLPAYAVRPKLAREQSASRRAGQPLEPSSKAVTHSVNSSCQPWQLPKQSHDRCTKANSCGRGMHAEFDCRATVRLPPLLPAKSISGYSSKKVPIVTAESTNHSVLPAGLRACRRS